MFKKAMLMLGVLSVSFFSSANTWDEQIETILSNIEQQALKHKDKPIIAKTKLLTERLLKTHKKSYLKMEVESSEGRVTTQEVFYSANDFFVTMYKNEAVSQEFNLYFQNGWIHQWNTGDIKGVKYPASTFELISYVGYAINPLGLVSTFYEDYLEYPETFNTHKEPMDPWTELEFTVRRFTYKSLLVDLDDVWFYGFKTFNPETLKVSTFWINPPQTYQMLPKMALEEFKNVTFEIDTKQSIQQHMKYINVVPGKLN
ncbi:hypothetical protein [Marinicellulosiphila megalodicopiae]|uniref:hypothetical protein n=1 Tax=Marinicellulosiphila megalodicopiae TaxID=2724896 RepID=UPI003BB1E54E